MADEKPVGALDEKVGRILDTLRKPPFPTDTILGHAMRGEHHHVVDFLYRNDSFAHGRDIRYQIVQQMIQQPAQFVSPFRTFELATAKHFDYEKFFEYLQRKVPDIDITATCWTMRERAPSSEMTKISAELLAESLRHQIIKKGELGFSAASLVGADTEEFKLTHAMARANKLAQFIIVQNELVRYVEQNANKQPANRGAAFLNIIGDHVDASLWTQKMTDIREVRVDSLKDGSSVIWKSIYAPKP